MSAVDVVRALYESFADGDTARPLELLAEDCVITQEPTLPWGGEYVGHAGAMKFFSALYGAVDSEVTTLALFEAGPEVVQYGRTAGQVRASGARFDVPEMHLWTVSGGRIVAAHFSIDTPAMLAALGDGGVPSA